MLSIQFYSTMVSKIMECGYFLERKRSFIVLPVLEMQKLSGKQKQIVVSSKLIHCRSRLSGKKQQKNIKHQLKLFKWLTTLKSMFIVYCLIYFYAGYVYLFFFQVAVTFTCEYGVVKTPTHTKQNQTSCIQNMRCTYVKNTIVCTVKCRCINCGYGKLSVQSVKRIKREPPLLTTSLSSQTSLESCLTQEKKESDRG